jgi:hypothetical protein
VFSKVYQAERQEQKIDWLSVTVKIVRHPRKKMHKYRSESIVYPDAYYLNRCFLLKKGRQANKKQQQGCCFFVSLFSSGNGSFSPWLCQSASLLSIGKFSFLSGILMKVDEIDTVI